MNVYCQKHHRQELKVHGGNDMDGNATLYVETCPKCVAEADAHGYEVGEADGKHEATLTTPTAEHVDATLARCDDLTIAAWVR